MINKSRLEEIKKSHEVLKSLYERFPKTLLGACRSSPNVVGLAAELEQKWPSAGGCALLVWLPCTRLNVKMTKLAGVFPALVR